MPKFGLDAIAIGVDIGGTRVKIGLVDLAVGTVLERASVATPQPPVIDDVVDAVADTVARMDLRWRTTAGSIAVTLGVATSGDVRDGDHTSGVTLHPSWNGAPTRSLIEQRLGRAVRMINDADAAGIAEARYGALRGNRGVAVLLTFGTGIGSAIMLGRQLLPNSGLGEFPFRGVPVETLLSVLSRERRGLDWHAWAQEVNQFLTQLDGILRPDLVVVGGGAAEAWSEFGADLRAPYPVVRASLGNDAGVIGAAFVAARPIGPRGDQET